MKRDDPLRVPCVWVVASHRTLGNELGQPQCYTVMDEAGTRTLINMGLQPVCFPRVPPQRIALMLEAVDGVLLGGSATNVHPALFGERPIDPEMAFDECRDALVQPLVRLALARRVPVISFCRGSHDFNVAMGGTMYQSLEAEGRFMRHWEDASESVEEQYIERHFVTCEPQGELVKITGMGRFPVSSLHHQGVRELAPELVAEAHADDGLVEAFRSRDPSLFAWGFQFHPEWGWRWHPAYGRIMNAFVRACWEHFARRSGAAIPARELVA
ncbi:MAG TPA: gamma-glutamyl-gamma-aminobutyrate hydrolase family protein [Ramlibacter sp.]|uniref:gamma-glutamyl-gamma-aminobutyrate hydrolase family protein n=1 Tax=Ramlibacter sp. TaxID=1917967 RepID=UPI002B716973|nr:gamma-glutamyl-gamma-aminobutyrate hydrolase family protein [Ramlibacter sp.]HVZ44010.1 gamma-glutamyl-gamma-aminobutyrate hydrolase family protein [Ramlibacter sp.]